MSIQGMPPRYAYTDNNYGVKLQDCIQLRNEYKNKYNAKFTIPKKDTYYSTDKFIGLSLYNNIAKPSMAQNKTSTIDKDNQVDFRSGEWITLGEYNGVTVKMRQKNGFIGTNLSVPAELASKPGERINEYERKVGEMIEKISDSQHKEISNILRAFGEFSRVASDESAIQNINIERHKHLIAGLGKMGVDLSKPFAINGEEFYLRNDTKTIDYYNKKQFVMRSDGKVEVHNASDDDTSDIWSELSRKYDIRSASFDEMCEISSSLYEAGQITLFEHALFIFDPSKSPMTPDLDICLTPAGPDGKRDWISEYEARAAQDFSMGNMQSYKHMQKALDILRKLV